MIALCCTDYVHVRAHSSKAFADLVLFCTQDFGLYHLAPLSPLPAGDGAAAATAGPKLALLGETPQGSIEYTNLTKWNKWSSAAPMQMKNGNIMLP